MLLVFCNLQSDKIGWNPARGLHPCFYHQKNFYRTAIVRKGWCYSFTEVHHGSKVCGVLLRCTTSPMRGVSKGKFLCWAAEESRRSGSSQSWRASANLLLCTASTWCGFKSSMACTTCSGIIWIKAQSSLYCPFSISAQSILPKRWRTFLKRSS